MTRKASRVDAPDDQRRVVPEFTRLVDISRLGQHAHRLPVVAGEAERSALAKRFDLMALDRLDADLILKKRGDGIVSLSGRFSARVAQRCVVSLEPVWNNVDEPIELYFGAAQRRPGAPATDPFDDEAFPEPLIGGRIDCGEAVAQALALSLDPYPRAPGAAR